MANPQALSDEIDSLLIRYLGLLDEYTSLRGTLGSLQSSIYTDIARANFQAERGVNYGREAYDHRTITAGRVCRITGDSEDGTAIFNIAKVDRAAENTGKEKDGKESSEAGEIEEGMKKVNISTEQGEVNSETQDPDEDKEDIPASKPTQIPDPIRLFGFSIPSALRTARSSSVQLVENTIPRLASVSTQMRALEIQIRRARKHRAKALASVVEGGSAKGGGREEVVI